MNYLLGVDISRCVVIGKNVCYPHNSFETVIHDNTVIENNVKIYQNVTLGRADIYNLQKIRVQRLRVFLLKKVMYMCRRKANM